MRLEATAAMPRQLTTEAQIDSAPCSRSVDDCLGMTVLMRLADRWAPAELRASQQVKHSFIAEAAVRAQRGAQQAEYAAASCSPTARSCCPPVTAAADRLYRASLRRLKLKAGTHVAELIDRDERLKPRECREGVTVAVLYPARGRLSPSLTLTVVVVLLATAAQAHTCISTRQWSPTPAQCACRAALPSPSSAGSAAAIGSDSDGDELRRMPGQRTRRERGAELSLALTHRLTA